MKFILMIYFGSTYTGHAGQSGFSVEFDAIERCKSAYMRYVENKPKGTLGVMSGVCVKK